MKVLKKKLKKVHIVKKIFYFLTLIIYLLTFGYFVYGILKLKGIEDIIRYGIIAFFTIWFFMYALCGLLTMITKKTKTFIAITFLSLLFTPVFGISSYYINKVYGSLSSINSNEVEYTSKLIALNKTNFNDKLIIGMVESENDIEGHILAKELYNKEGLKNKIYTYEDYHSMISDLYKGKIGACFVSGNFEVTLGHEVFEDLKPGEENIPIGKRVKVLYEYSKMMENQDNIILEDSKGKKLTEPFTVLIMGVDSTKDGLKKNQAFNGDTLILATFNPNTITGTMFSIPRDMYVPIACNHNRYNKINSSAAYGSTCVINTIQQLTDINIDYYVKINFMGVVELVDAVGGVTVDVEEPDFRFNGRRDCGGKVCEQNSLRQFGNEMIFIEPGIQTLNGEQALAYARNRHQYALSDIARNQHQQQIIEALASKAKSINSINNFEDILNSVSRNIETNMTPEQILSFYDVGKDMLLNSTGNQLSIKKTYLSYYNLRVYLPGPGRYTSALGYYQPSLDAITDLMKVNLGLQKEKPIKTFDYSYNENYKSPITGFGIAGGTKLETVKPFIGLTEEEANTWCIANDLTCTFEPRANIAPLGQIVDQSVHEGVLINNMRQREIIFYVSDGTGPQNEGSGTIPTPPVVPNTPEDPGKEEENKPTEPDIGNGDKPKPNPEPNKPDPEHKPNPEPSKPDEPVKPDKEENKTE